MHKDTLKLLRQSVGNTPGIRSSSEETKQRLAQIPALKRFFPEVMPVTIPVTALLLDGLLLVKNPSGIKPFLPEIIAAIQQRVPVAEITIRTDKVALVEALSAMIKDGALADKISAEKLLKTCKIWAHNETGDHIDDLFRVKADPQRSTFSRITLTKRGQEFAIKALQVVFQTVDFFRSMLQ